MGVLSPTSCLLGLALSRNIQCDPIETRAKELADGYSVDPIRTMGTMFRHITVG